MTKPRKQQVSLEDTPYYHCMVRCVRRAYLCGEDKETGENFDHRKQWLVSRLRFLSYVYAIDICAYAIMSNHYHVVLHVDDSKAKAWSDEEVVERWSQLYKGQLLVDRWLKDGASLSKPELDTVKDIIAVWRERLTSISWFMRGVNETIARMANEEDGCKGRFWEGRFKSQALLDEAALLSCMAYVDLNPVRAAMAENIIESDFTSLQQRLIDYANEQGLDDKTAQEKLSKTASHQKTLKQEQSLQTLEQAELMAFDGKSSTPTCKALPFTFADYLALVDSTGRIIREDKRGAISIKSQKLIQRVGLDPDNWLSHIIRFGHKYGSHVGSRLKLKQLAESHGQAWFRGCG